MARAKLCKCECGETFKSASSSTLYVQGHAPSQKERAKTQHRKNKAEQVDAQEFAALLLKLKADHGLQWKDIAERTGRSIGTVTSYGLGRKVWVSKRVSEDILGRLAGHANTPTKQQLAAYTGLRRKDQSEQRAETLKFQKLDDQKAKVDQLRIKLGQI